MGRNLEISVGEYYHVYNRGTNKTKIFLDQNDYNRFLLLLYISNNTDTLHLSNLLDQGRSLVEIFSIERTDTLVDIGAYCLMENHFHLLVKEKVEDGLSQFMKKILTAHSMYFNTRGDRSGTLFEGRFKAKHADTDEYLKYLFAYIHLNPLKYFEPKWKEIGIIDLTGAKKYLSEYLYSSYSYYIGTKRIQDTILESASFPDYFHESKSFESFITDWLTFSKDIANQGRSLAD